MEKLIFQGTNEKNNSLQIVDVNRDFKTNLINMGMNSFVIKNANNALYKDIITTTYLTTDNYHYAKSSVYFRDINNDLYQGEYFTTLEISTNKIIENYSI